MYLPHPRIRFNPRPFLVFLEYYAPEPRAIGDPVDTPEGLGVVAHCVGIDGFAQPTQTYFPVGDCLNTYRISLRKPTWAEHCAYEQKDGKCLWSSKTRARMQRRDFGLRDYSARPQGGELHEQLIRKTDELLVANGFSTKQEAHLGLPNGRECFADVLAKKGSRQVAVEIQTTERTHYSQQQRIDRYYVLGLNSLWLFAGSGTPGSGTEHVSARIVNPEAGPRELLVEDLANGKTVSLERYLKKKIKQFSAPPPIDYYISPSVITRIRAGLRQLTDLRDFKRKIKQARKRRRQKKEFGEGIDSAILQLAVGGTGNRRVKAEAWYQDGLLYVIELSLRHRVNDLCDISETRPWDVTETQMLLAELIKRGYLVDGNGDRINDPGNALRRVKIGVVSFNGILILKLPEELLAELDPYETPYGVTEVTPASPPLVRSQ